MEQLELDLRIEFKVGDIVRVVRRVNEEDGWYNSWVENMNSYVNNGQTYTVDNVNRTGVRFANYGWPASALQLVQPP